MSTRGGGPSSLHLEYYNDALSDPSSGLMYPALVGLRKQSVVDAERMFNPQLAKYMERNGHEYENAYISAVWGWREAHDRRGLTEVQRSDLNKKFLHFILD